MPNLNFYICPFVYLAMRYLSRFMIFAYVKQTPAFHVTAGERLPRDYYGTALSFGTEPFLVGAPPPPKCQQTKAHLSQHIRTDVCLLSYLGHTETAVLT